MILNRETSSLIPLPCGGGGGGGGREREREGEGGRERERERVKNTSLPLMRKDVKINEIVLLMLLAASVGC